jgi:hypothetical protein
MSFTVSLTTSLRGGGLEQPLWSARGLAVDGANGNEGADKMSPLHELEVAHKFRIMLKLKKKNFLIYRKRSVIFLYM